jgi:hypothetical protein
LQPEGVGLEDRQQARPSRACVAVARKLAVIMQAVWRDGSEFRFKADANVVDGAVNVLPKRIAAAA